MYTYQDFLEKRETESGKQQFVLNAINEYLSSREYKQAIEAELYYKGENPTITRYEKVLYDLQGRAYRDMYTANHKISSNFFGFVTDQQVSYLLGNGVTFGEKETKDKLGTKSYPIDRQVSTAARYSVIHGLAFGFWNYDHVEIFKATEFVPLYDEENGALRAGIRFWQVDSTKPLRATLYEEDGYTEYIRRTGEEVETLREKRRYKISIRSSEIDGTEIFDGANYEGFPIVPLKNNDDCRSEICGKRNTIDALDLATSSMVNNVDEGNIIYWVLQNCGGMDDLDDLKFIEKIKTTHVVHPDGDADATAEPHTIEAPYAGTQAAIDMLIRRLYTDFQAFDSTAVTAGNQTATAIKASYVPLDLKCDKFEYQVTRFLTEIMRLAGVDDEPTYTRNQIINKTEEVQTLLLGAQYVDEEYIRKKFLTILGDADQLDDIVKRMQADELNRFSAVADNTANNQEGADDTAEPIAAE